MAARLIRRSSRLLAASVSSLQPLSSCSAPLECARPCQLAPSFHPRAALHASAPCHRPPADSLPELSQGPGAQGDGEFYATLLATPTAEELLKMAAEQEVNGNRGSMIIQQLSRRELADKQALLNDPRFQELLEVVNSQIQYVWNGRLIKLLRSLHLLGLDPKSRYLQSVEIEVRWRLRRFSIGALAQLASFLSPMSRPKEEKSLLGDLVKQVELRWTEIKDTRTLVTLLSRLGSMSNSLMERLEDKVLEFADQLTPEESRRIVVSLAAQNRRTLPVLRALSFHLVQHRFELAPPLILDLAFAYAKLNFCQLQVLQRMATDILPRIPELSPADVARLVRSIASLKFSNLPLCEAIAQACIERSESFSTSHLCTVVMGFAHLNFQPNQSDEFFSMVHQHLSAHLDSLSWPLQLDVVWALCVLGQVTPSYLQKVLEPRFYAQVLGTINETSPKSISHCLKLLHINTTAQLECGGDYGGALLPDDVLRQLLSRSQAGNTSNLQNGVRDALKIVFPEAGACNFNAHTAYGWSLDGEVVLDSEMKALPLKDLAAPHSLQSGGPLPEGARRFAIVTRDFSNYCFRTKDLLGRYAMKRRHLQAAGFLVVEVPFYDWQELKSEWQKQCFLKDQMKKALAEEMAR
ncbi:FAST kinase domain-containing protein 4 [Gastrophryne carolinensis]